MNVELSSIPFHEMWYYFNNDMAQKGPVPEQVLREVFEKGDITRENINCIYCPEGLFVEGKKSMFVRVSVLCHAM